MKRGTMTITLQDNFRVRDLVDKIQNVTRDEGLQLIYEWVKTEHINFGVYSLLIEKLPLNEINQ